MNSEFKHTDPLVSEIKTVEFRGLLMIIGVDCRTPSSVEIEPQNSMDLVLSVIRNAALNLCKT